MTRAALLAGVALAACLAQAAAALDKPRPVDPSEPQMRRHPYNPHGRTHIINTPGRSTILAFAPDENIKRVVVGKEGIWEGPKPEEVAQAPLGNVLPLWAVTTGRTTIQVITSRPGASDRAYQFAAEVRETPPFCDKDGMHAAGGIHPCHDDPDATYGLVFAYPDDEKRRQATETVEARAAARERARAAREARDRAVAVARLQTDFTCVNGLYEGIPMKDGDRTLAPDDACDDGQSIGVLFKGARPIPSVFLVDRDGKNPRAIRTTTRGDWVIVPALRERIRLVLGDRHALDVVNRAFSPHGRDPGTGTGSPDVARDVVQAPGGGNR